MKVQLDTANLDKVLRALKGKLPVAKVGILGDKTNRGGGNSTNAEIGQRHEFGLGVRRRSFLRVPLIKHLPKFLEDAGFTAQAVVDALVADDVPTLVKELGMIGENCVREGFNTQGFGEWPDHAPGYTNNTGEVLVDTQQLRNSISSEVSE